MQRIFLFLSFLLSFLFPKAQSLQLSTYNIDEGLSRGLIKSVITDDIGFLWSATDEGVIRFDGHTSKFYKEFLPRGYAKTFFKSSDRGFYVVHDFGVSQIFSEPDTAYIEDFIPGALMDTDSTLFYPKNLYEDSKGTLWINESLAIVRLRNGEFTKFRFGIEDQGYFDLSFSLSEDASGNLWALSYGGHLFYFDLAKDKFVNIPLTNKISKISCLIDGGDGRFLIGAREGLFQIEADTEAKEIENKLIADVHNISTGIILDQREIYLGTFDNGLYYSPGGGELKFERIDLFPFEDILSLHFDKNGLWICSTETVGLLHPVIIGQFRLGKDPVHIESISYSNDGSLVIAAGNNVYILGKNSGNWRIENEILTSDTFAVMNAYKHGNEVWIGGFRGELLVYDLKEKTFEEIKGIRQGGPGPIVKKIYKDRKNNIWLSGNHLEGLIRFSEDGRYFSYSKDGLVFNTVVEEGPDGYLYCGGGGSPESYIFRYHRGEDQFEDISVPLPFETEERFIVQDIEVTGEAVLMGTSHGLLKLTLGLSEVARIDLQKVPVNEPVKALALSRDSTLWASTSEGLVQFRKDERVLLFDYTSGLPSRTLKYRGLLIDPDNRLWVGTARGLAYFEANETQLRETPRPIFRTLQVNGRRQPYNSSETYDFPHKSFIEAIYLSLSFPADRIKYQTRISGIDSMWSESSFGRRTTISSLSPGAYIFQVRAQQHGGLLWSEPLSLRFEILPPWYQNTWAILLFLLGAAALIGTSVKVYNYNLLKKNERLEKIIRDRTREINRQKNEIIDQKNKIITQKEKLIKQNELVYKTQKALADADIRNKELQEQQLRKELESKNKHLTTITLKILQKSETLKELKSKIEKISAASSKSSAELNRLVKLIDRSFRLEKDWEEFTMCFEQVHVGFYKTLKSQFPELTTHDLRHCALIRLNMTISETADVLGVSPESVKIFRFRLKKKLDVESQKELVEYIMSI